MSVTVAVVGATGQVGGVMRRLLDESVGEPDASRAASATPTSPTSWARTAARRSERPTPTPTIA